MAGEKGIGNEADGICQIINIHGWGERNREMRQMVSARI